MARDDPEVRLRLPEALKSAISDAAQEAGRSMNAEIVRRLAESFSDVAGETRLVAAAERIERLVEIMLRHEQHSKLGDLQEAQAKFFDDLHLKRLANERLVSHLSTDDPDTMPAPNDEPSVKLRKPDQ